MKDFMSKNWVIITVLVISIVIGYGSVIFLGKNNVIEVEVERLIEIETGVKIDLTPDM